MFRILTFTPACLLLLALSAPAQPISNGSIRGHVKDEQGGFLPGVSVTATSPDAPWPASAVTDERGLYRLLDLPPGTYTISAELSGFARFVRENIVVRAGLNLGLDIDLKVGSLNETVEVQADTPMVESRTAVQAVNISGEFQRSLPINTRRHWSDFMSVTPGVSTIQIGTGTSDTYYLRGSYFASHALQVDGADVGSAQQSEFGTVHLSRELIEDVQVKTGGIDASAPLGVGAVINVATKSGTNQFRGSAAAILQPESWNGNNTPGGTSSTQETVLPELSLGGPLVRDRLWFFTAFRYERFTSGISRSAEQIALLRALDPSFEPFSASLSGKHLFLKGSSQLSTNHQLQASYTYDPQNRRSGNATEAATFLDRVNGGDLNFSGSLSSLWGSSVTTRFGFAYNNRAQQILARPDVPSIQVHSAAFPSAGRITGTGTVATLQNGNAGWTFDQPYYRSVITGDLTYYRPGLGGSHELQMGFSLAPKDHQESIQRYANGGFSREETVLIDPSDPARGTRPFHREIFDVSENINSLSDSRDLAIYVQDGWRPTSRLTVNAGVRVDFIKRTDKLFDMVVQDSTEVGPRFGVNYILTADHKNAVRASWVRVHDVLPANLQSAGTSTAGKQDLYDVDLDGTFETVLVTPGATALTTNRIIDLARGQPYIHEFITGYKRQLPGRMTFDVSLVRREYRNRTALVEVNGIYDGGVFQGYQDERFNEIFQLTGNRRNWHVYSGVELQATKQTNRMQLLATYTRSWRHLAGTWQPNDPASFIQPDAFPNDSGLGGVRNSNSNSLSGTADTGDNQGWRDHTLRMGAVFKAPWNMILATNFSVDSGAYGGPIVMRIASPEARFGPSQVRLSNGRLVSNPLATVVRFAYPTRGEGQNQLDRLTIWNARIGRDVRFRGHRIEMALDVFNIVNADADQAPMSGANQVYSPNFGRAFVRQLPRSAQVSLRYAF